MVMKEVLHMNSGDGETSYANNSVGQKVVISKMLPVLEDALKAMYTDHLGQLPKRFRIVDLGCASGPNSLFAMSFIVNTIEDLCKQRKNNIDELPKFEVFLNDLPDNDFNNLFKLLPSFYQAHKKGKERGSNVFVYGLPGSFYSQLFPKKSLHFAYSSNSLHWLSQVPEGLKNNNRENIYIATTSGPEVVKAYKRQYQRDFSSFLRLRSEEIVTGGRMVLTFVGRSVDDPTTNDESAHFILLAKLLLEMVTEGLVKLEDLYSFNLPFYMPSKQEVMTEIQREGSFTLEKLHHFRTRWDANENTKYDQNDDMFFDEYKSGKLVADCFRAFMEPMLASHFGSSIIDNLFERYAKKMGEHLSMGKSSHFIIVISLGRKEMKQIKLHTP